MNEKILVVDDEKEIADLVEYYLTNEGFEVKKFYDANAAWEFLKNNKVDMAILDVMMPGIDGMELLRRIRIKDNFPVIMLTAKISEMDKIEGLSTGADDYIAKPFETDILVAKCGAILRNRDILRKKYISGSGTGMTETGSVPAQGQSAADEAVSGASADGTVNQSVHMSRMDSEFAATVMNLIRSHLDDPDLDINFMCRELALSRTLLFVKIKGVFGKTPTGLVQDVRLEEAAWLLREKPDMMISEVADMVGVNSLQYFGKIFRSHFGMTPRAYRSAHGR